VPNLDHFSRHNRLFCQHNIQLRRLGVGGAFVEAEDLGGTLRNRALNQVGRVCGRGLRRTVATRLDVNFQFVRHDLDTLDGQFGDCVRVAVDFGQGGGLLGAASGEHGLGAGEMLLPLLGEVVHFRGERVRKVVCVLV